MATVKIVFVMIFGRTDLRTGVSEAKFDREADFEVRSAVAPQKPYEKNVFGVESFFDRESFETRFGKVSCRGSDLKTVLKKF